MDLVKATAEVHEYAIERLQHFRADDQDTTFSEAFAGAVQMYGDDIPQPRVTTRQHHRNNVPSDSPFQY